MVEKDENWTHMPIYRYRVELYKHYMSLLICATQPLRRVNIEFILRNARFLRTDTCISDSTPTKKPMLCCCSKLNAYFVHITRIHKSVIHYSAPRKQILKAISRPHRPLYTLLFHATQPLRRRQIYTFMHQVLPLCHYKPLQSSALRIILLLTYGNISLVR